LSYEIFNNEIILKCQLCNKHKRSKIFTEGAKNKIAKDLTQHVKSIDHRAAENSEKIRLRNSYANNLNNPQNLINYFGVNLNDNSRIHLFKLFKCAYFCAKRNLPLSVYEGLDGFLESFRIDLGLHYKDNNAILRL